VKLAQLLAAINALLTSLFDVLLRPLAGLPPLASLAIVSLLTAVVMLLVVRRTSNQRALDDVKRKIHAALFEIRLFNDDLRAIFRAQGEMLRHNVTYLRLSLVPMLWMIVPFVFVIAQLQFRYGYDGLAIGRPVLLTAHLRSGAVATSGEAGRMPASDENRADDVAALEAPAGIRADTPAVWFPAAQDVVWRITPERAGDYQLRLKVAGQTLTKSVHVSSQVARRAPSRLEAGLVNELLYPAEPPLPADAPVTSIAIAYPDRDIDVFGWRLNWMVVFFILSIVFAYALRKPFGVTL
jgi:uncharacterized membrane protein (DUF106 family)